MILFRPLGIPYDLIVHPSKVDDLMAMAAIQQRRYLTSWPAWAMGGAAFAVSLLGVLAFAYRAELAVACLLIVLPQVFVNRLARRTATRLDFQTVDGVRKPLLQLQTYCQFLGFAVICLASFVGSAWLFTLGG